MLNNISIMGRLTDTPELKTTNSGKSVCSFTIANDKDIKKDDNTPPNWIDCVAWGKTAEFLAKYFCKGSMLAISGSLQTRQYQDKNGNKRKATEVLANSVYFAESKKDKSVKNPASAFTQQAESQGFVSADISDDDLPF